MNPLLITDPFERCAPFRSCVECGSSPRGEQSPGGRVQWYGRFRLHAQVFHSVQYFSHELLFVPMGAMNKLRENTGVILWILVISFGVIWTLQDSDVFEAMEQPGRNVAVVNGSPIQYDEYQRSLDQQRQRFQQQFGGDLSPQMQEQMRQQAYDQLIQQQLLEQEMDRLGISVTDAEVEEMVFGENPHPVIRQQFADSTGQINYQLLQNMAQNPQAKSQWLQLEQFLREQRRQQKMSSIVQATVHVSDQDVENYYWRQNVEASVQYVAQRYASVPDDSIQVTESDLRSYYDNNQEDFRRPKTLNIEYATVPKVPTSEDSASFAQDLEDLEEEFAAAENDSLFLVENASDRSFSSDYQTPTEMNESVADAVFSNPEPGRVAGPVFGGEYAHLVKIRDVRPAESDFVHARHILLESSEPDAALQERLQSIRDSIEAGTASFAEMARRYSDDGSASDGGDLGWFSRGRMADAFEAAAFQAQPGELVGPIRTEFGYHLIQVETRASSEAQIADLAYQLNPSQATLRDRENRLEDLAYFAEESGDFRQEAQRLDLSVQEVDAEAGQSAIPGLGQSRALSSFLESASSGDISDVIELPDKFAVAHVTGVQPEGYRSFEDVKAEIRPRVVLEKKKSVLVQRMQRALQQYTFQDLPQRLNTQMRSQSSVSFSTGTIPGVGQDPTFAGTVFGLDEGETSGVVEGENAAFVVEVTDMREPSPLTAQERQQLRQKLLKQQRQQVSSQWIAALKEEATIEDNRGQFN